MQPNQQYYFSKKKLINYIYFILFSYKKNYIFLYLWFVILEMLLVVNS